MATYTLSIDPSYVDAFEAACRRLDISEYTIDNNSRYPELYLTVTVQLKKPELLFALGSQYHFYKGVNLKIIA